MIKVGITGGIGSGKTTVCKIFESLGVPVYYADERAKKIMTSDKTLKEGIIHLLGEESYFKNGRLNRKFIGSKVFKNKSLLNKLNKLVHPAVLKDGENWFKKQKGVMALKEAALLIESGSYLSLDKLIVVTAPEKVRIQRVMERDKLSMEAVSQKMKNQLTDDEFLKYADFSIINDGKKLLIPQVRKIYKHIVKDALSKNKNVVQI